MQASTQTGRCQHAPSCSFQARPSSFLPHRQPCHRRPHSASRTAHVVCAERPRAEGLTDAEKKPDPKETTEKYGLEAGLWQVFTNKDPVSGKTKGQQAKDLLAKYGSAYLITSISFAIVSFAACYALVSAGVDIGAVLARVGITVNATNEKVGTVAIAYAAHKALSPVRFPPTVALTPVVARLLGRGKDGSSANGASSNGPTP